MAFGPLTAPVTKASTMAPVKGEVDDPVAPIVQTVPVAFVPRFSDDCRDPSTWMALRLAPSASIEIVCQALSAAVEVTPLPKVVLMPFATFRNCNEVEELSVIAYCAVV